jgi:hypothetical protein
MHIEYTTNLDFVVGAQHVHQFSRMASIPAA